MTKVTFGPAIRTREGSGNVWHYVSRVAIKEDGVVTGILSASSDFMSRDLKQWSATMNDGRQPGGAYSFLPDAKEHVKAVLER